MSRRRPRRHYRFRQRWSEPINGRFRVGTPAVVEPLPLPVPLMTVGAASGGGTLQMRTSGDEMG